ncbi:MAG: hypothetical protein ACPL7B_02265 [Candidatus Poribacteria bacterium]
MAEEVRKICLDTNIISDVLIAGICISSKSCLLAKNKERFRRIKNLEVIGIAQL